MQIQISRYRKQAVRLMLFIALIFSESCLFGFFAQEHIDHQDSLCGDEPCEGPQLPSLSDFRCEAKSKKGLLDRHYPASMSTKPQIHTVPPGLENILEPIAIGSTFTIDHLSPDFLKSLQTARLHKLFDGLIATKMKIKWKDAAGKTRSGGERLGVRLKKSNRSNGLAALALKMGILKESTLLEEIISYHPEATLPSLKNDAASILDVHIAGGAIRKILSEVHRYDSRQVAAAASMIAEVYIRYWSEGNANCLVYALTNLIVKTANISINDRVSFTSKQKGILLGALLAAALTYSNEIKSRSERHVWIVNTTANLAWATTALVAVVPVAVPVGAGIAATISLSAVIWAVVTNKIGFHNYTPNIKAIEGHVEFAVLELADDDTPMLGLLETLAWMRAAIHINGEFD